MSSMSINGSQVFGGTSGIGGLRPPPPPPGGGGKGGGLEAIANSVADTLGMSADDVTSALQQGRSLNDLAENQGVSHDDLVSALKAGMPDELSSSADADDIAESIAAGTGPSGVQGPPPPPPGGGAGFSGNAHGSAARVNALDGSVSGVLGSSLSSSQQSALDSLSSLLGTDSESLVETLRNGTSLSDLVQAEGIDSGSLADAIQNGLLVDTRY